MKQYSARYFRHYAISKRWVAWNLDGNKEHFDSEQAAKDFTATGGPVTEYRGYTISRTGQVIFKNGKRIFTAAWQVCESVEDAKKLIEATEDYNLVMIAEQSQGVTLVTPADNYEAFQIEKYGDVLPAPIHYPDGSVDGSEAEIERQAEWVERQAENQMFYDQY